MFYWNKIFGITTFFIISCFWLVMIKAFDLFESDQNSTRIIKNYEKKNSIVIPIQETYFPVSIVNRLKREANKSIDLKREISKISQQIHKLPEPLNTYDLTGHQQFSSSSYIEVQPNSYASLISPFLPFQQNQQQKFIIQLPTDSNDQSTQNTLLNENLMNTVPLYCTYIPAPTTFQFPVVPGEPNHDAFIQNSQAHTDKASNSKFNFFNPVKHWIQDFLQYCPNNFYRCNDGIKCISKLKLCDNSIDCLDASDETKCTCRDRISHQKLCDYHEDCPHGEDELGCFGCPKNSISCNDLSNNCFSLEERCNGSAICTNGKDEQNCNTLTDSYIYGNEMISVGSYTGFLQKNLQGRWYPICGYAYSWAKDACISELGSISKEPVFELVTSHQNKKGPYLIDDGYSGKLISECLQGMAYVRCPIYNTDTPFDQPLRSSDPYLAGSKQMNSRINDTNSDPIVGIVGGHNSLPGAWPFIVSINKNGNFHCGGVILNEWWILSAAHCFNNFKDHFYDVDAGVLRRYSYSPSRQMRYLNGVVIHEYYDSTTLQNDIALGLLNKPMFFNSWVRPARLPESDDRNNFFTWKQKQPRTGERCVAVGWGATQEGGSDRDHLQEVELAIINCTHVDDRNKAEICAGYREGGRDACQGDSGGPLMCRATDWNYNWYVGGIVSHGIGCGRRNEPGAYTRVSHFRNWINSIIYNRTGSEGVERTRSSCPGFSCKTPHSKCLPGKQRCDGVVNCLDAEDEDNCPNFSVPKLLDRLLGEQLEI